MFKGSYFTISLLLIIIALVVANCGGGSDMGAVPGIPQSQSEQFVTKNISGYIYYAPSPEDSEENKRFVILNAPLAGEDSFLSQLSSYYQESNPDFWSSAEMQVLYGTMDSEMTKWLPLPAYNPEACLYGIYQDSKSSSPISVNSDGYFETSVQVKTTDANISFEVVTGDSECYPVDGVSPSDITTSEETATELISCPEQIITLPGWFVIFAVRGEPAVNLKDSGLTFTLNDSSVGWVTAPFYLKCMGAWNYNIAYGIFLAKPGLSTPMSTTITAQTVTSLSINIFTEVVKSCASISGHVGGAGVIPAAGFVYSIGFDAFSCLDEAGNYKLNKVFRGHFRNVVAVYWLQENGVFTKHREERTIDFFDGDLSGFDLPAGVLPTPTVRPADDPFYDNQVVKVLYYLDKWTDDSGDRAQARQQVVEWINGDLSSAPDIPEGMAEAYINEYDDTIIEIVFEDGWTISISTELMPVPDRELADALLADFPETKINGNMAEKTPSRPLVASGATTFKPDKILMLDSITGWQYWFSAWESHNLVSHRKIGDFLENDAYYKDRSKVKLTGLSDFILDVDAAVTTPFPESPSVDANTPYIPCRVNPAGSGDNIVTPWDYGNLVGEPDTMADYGFVHIQTHGSRDSITACLYLEDDPRILGWVNKHNTLTGNIWTTNYMWIDLRGVDCHDPLHDIPDTAYVKTISLKRAFFTQLYAQNPPPQNGVIFLIACEANEFSSAFQSSGLTVVCNSGCPCPMWDAPYSYFFMDFMIHGYWPMTCEPGLSIRGATIGPVLSVDPYTPMHVEEAFDTLRYKFNASPDPGDYTYWPWSEFAKGWHWNDCEMQMLYPSSDDIYFPGGVEVIVSEE